MEELSKAGWQGTHQSHAWENPEDVERLTLEYERCISGLQQQYPGCELHVDFTSGTKAMSAAVVAAGLAKGAVKLYYATGPRDSGGRATRTTQLIALATDQLIGRRRIDEAGLLFDRGQFEAARRIAEDIQPSLSDPKLCARAASLIFMAEVCDAWQRFDWGKAFSKLRSYNKQPQIDHLRTAGWDVEHLGRVVGYLKKAKKHEKHESSKATPERLVDLFANAERCIQTARYDDAVARLYRLVEYLAQTRLAMMGLKSTSNVPRETLKDLAPKACERLATRFNGDTVNLGLRNAIEVLDEKQDPLGKKMAAQYFGQECGSSDRTGPRGPLGNCLEKRNNSLLAHGSKPIGKEDAGQLCGMVEEFLREHVGESWDSLLEQARFPRCPWAPSQPLPELMIASAEHV